MPETKFESVQCSSKIKDGNQFQTSTSKEIIVPVENDSKPKISTLVFMDLESTGLPSDVGKRNVHITEMSLVAVDRQSFEIDKKFRVLNKINLCIKPRFHISPGSMMVTGLYNDILENQEEFDDSVPKLLEYFFRRLQKPICLLAHNGNRFDFPVLQAELNRLNYSLGPDIVCADTLVAFRAICQLEKQVIAIAAKNKKEGKEMQVEVVLPITSTPIHDEDIDLLLSQDLESFAAIDHALDETILEPDESFATENKREMSTVSEKGTVFKEFLSPSQNETTPQKSNIEVNVNVNVMGRKRKVLDTTYLPKSHHSYNKRKVIAAKRNLFPEDDEHSLEIHKITRFSLENLYNHFFHESPTNSHYAEVDCISLSKVCQKISNRFLKWIDESSVTFSSIEALW